MKIGDKFKIHCYKHNGKIYQASEEAVILDIFEDYIVCGNNMVTVTENNGRSYRTKELAIIYFYKNKNKKVFSNKKPAFRQTRKRILKLIFRFHRRIWHLAKTAGCRTSQGLSLRHSS